MTARTRIADVNARTTALQTGQIDAMDIYTTDARIGRMGLRVLQDDLGYFPRYDAMLLYRLDAAQRFPAAWRALQAEPFDVMLLDLQQSLNETFNNHQQRIL